MIEILNFQRNRVEGVVERHSVFNLQRRLYDLKETKSDRGNILILNGNDQYKVGLLRSYFVEEFLYDIGDNNFAVNTSIPRRDRIRKGLVPIYTIRRFAKRIMEELDKEYGLRSFGKKEHASFYTFVGGETIEFYAFLKNNIGYKFIYDHTFEHIKTEIFNENSGEFVEDVNRRHPYFLVNEILRNQRFFLRRRNHVK